MRSVSFIVALLALVLGLSRPIVTAAQEATPAPAAEPPSQPSQPATGPGGADFAYDGIRAQHFGPWPAEAQAGPGSGSSSRSVHAMPAPPSPTRVTAGDLPPRVHHHRSRVVSRLDRSPRAPRGDPRLPRLRARVRLGHGGPGADRLRPDARGHGGGHPFGLDGAGTDEHARADLTRVAVVGASFGAILGADYAAEAAGQGLPQPTALLLANPGCASWRRRPARSWVTSAPSRPRRGCSF